jgi:predicted RNase H-like HicB family nuclease
VGGSSHEEGCRTARQPDPARGGCRMTMLYPIVLETEESGAVSAYVPGLPVYAAADTHAEAERALRAVLAEYLNAHPTSRPAARVRVARVSDRGKPRVSVVGVAALVGAKRSDAKARASRANGRLGGRPPKNATTRTTRTKASR